MEESNVNNTGKAAPQYMAEWEFYDFFERRKIVERSWPKTSEEVRQFREQLATIDFNNLNNTSEGSRVLTGVRIYKGDEIICDHYWQLSELASLKVLSTKIVSFKK